MPYYFRVFYVAVADAVAVLFVWNGDWERDTADRRWKFTGDQSNMVLVASDTTFAQMMAKAYATCKVSSCEYDIRMTGWFAYEKKGSCATYSTPK